MNRSKSVKVSFHTFVKCMLKSGEHIEEPFYMIEEVIGYISSISDKRKRYYELKGGKFCFIDSINKETIDENVTLFMGVCKSARNEFRPNLINKKTGNERKNPKELSEGDIELTHFLLIITRSDDEVYLLLERNHNGVTHLNFTNYISEFTKKYLEQKGQKKDFSVTRMDVPTNNFLTELERLNRTVQAEVYFDKQLLGSDALNFSERTLSVRKNIMLTVKANPRDSITEFGVDLWNKINKKDSLVSRIRIKGTNDESNNIILDSDMMSRKEYITVDLNQETGEVNSVQLLSEMRKIAMAF